MRQRQVATSATSACSTSRPCACGKHRSLAGSAQGANSLASRALKDEVDAPDHGVVCQRALACSAVGRAVVQ